MGELSSIKDRYTDPDTGAHFRFADIHSKLLKILNDRFYKNKKVLAKQFYNSVYVESSHINK
jgi:hypothetical protein